MKCPKCGAGAFKGTPKYKCGSWADEDGWSPIEGADCVARQRDQLAERVKELEAALVLVVPTCEHLHHEKKYRHLAHEPCPVREIVMKAKGLK